MQNEKLQQKTFIASVCNECGICESANGAELCFMLYQLSPDNFIRRVVKIGKIVDRSDMLDRKFLRSLNGFMDLICNEDFCPMYTTNCNYPKQKLSCYHFWLGVGGSTVTKDEISNLFVVYRRQISDIVDNKKSKIDIAWSNLTKRKKKKVRSLLKVLIKGVYRNKNVKQKTPKNYNHEQKKEENKITTSVFYSSNKEWVEHLKTIIDI